VGPRVRTVPPSSKILTKLNPPKILGYVSMKRAAADVYDDIDKCAVTKHQFSTMSNTLNPEYSHNFRMNPRSNYPGAGLQLAYNLAIVVAICLQKIFTFSKSCHRLRLGLTIALPSMLVDSKKLASLQESDTFVSNRQSKFRLSDFE
jgi:hypothetical protein